MRNFVAVIVLLVPAVATAQQPATLKLRPHDAKLESGFAQVTSIRELSDGRIIVSDPTDQQLVVADFRTGSVTQISRKGAGPNEYGVVPQVRAITGDSSIMSDIMQRRWLLMDGDKVVVTIPPDNPIFRRIFYGIINGADRLGHVMFGVLPNAPTGETVTSAADSESVVLLHRGTGRSDTVAKVLARPFQRMVSRNAKGEVSASSARALRLRVGEQFLLNPDGWLAVVRINPFRVDWRSPNGQWTLGKALPIPVIRMTDKEKKASLARTAASMAANPSSTPLPPQLQTPDDDWPEVMPPYIYSDMTFTPEGHVLLRRQPSADFPGVAYYAVDRRGVLAGIIEMKDNERIFGFGAKSLYIIESDADDLKFVRRHPWPFTTNRPG